MERNFSKIKTRILKYADYKAYSKRKIYLDTGISNGVLDKSNGLTEFNIEKFISTYKEVDIEWLMTGKGGMLKNETVVTEKPGPDQSYVIEVQAKLIHQLEEKVKELKKAREPGSTYRNVAEPGQ